MDKNKINSFADFCTEIQKIGFSIGGGNAEGIFTIAQYYTNRIKDHTGDIDTDPWEWRIKGITISGQKQKISKEGKPYGWPVTTFCTIEEFWGNSILEDSKDIDPLFASDLITKRILELNETAKMSKINKFMDC